MTAESRPTPGGSGRAASLSGQVAVVTGGARGIGRAIAERLIWDGASVAILDSDADAAAETASGLGCHSLGIDVTEPAAVQAAVEDIGRELGTIGILVNNAGIAGRSAPIWELALGEWEQVLAVNLSAVFICCRAVIPQMRAAGYGRIVNVASIAGKEGNPNAVPYSATKAGVIGLTKAVAKEVVRDGILVNCVTPAVIETPMNMQVSEEHKQYMLARIPMGRAGKPAEVAELVAWMCSARCSFSTGAVFDISGGRATY
jgi:2-dehydro-3-deoxy-L-rhamnonate dehydrogenase (NAD+)